MSITNEELLARLGGEDVDTFTDYTSFGFEAQVGAVAAAIQTIHTEDRDEPLAFTFSWDGELEGGVNGLLVTVYIGDFVYLARFVELKHLTNDREATGQAQAFAIRDALMDAYDDVLAVITKHNIRRTA